MKVLQINESACNGYPIFSSKFSTLKASNKLFNKLLAETEGKKYLAIWITGTSGVSTATLFLSLAHKKLKDIIIRIIHVRKESDTHHHDLRYYENIIEYAGDRKYTHVFMDDCIATGETFLKVKKIAGRIDVVLVLSNVVDSKINLLKDNNVDLLIHSI